MPKLRLHTGALAIAAGVLSTVPVSLADAAAFSEQQMGLSMQARRKQVNLGIRHRTVAQRSSG